MIRRSAFALAMALLAVASCNDPYSQRRIARRTANLNETTVDISDRERDGQRRVREAGETLQKWWRTDNERWNSRAPTIGDYIW